MKDRDCVTFLQWALPRLDLRWPGFRKVRKQVGKRLGRRIRDLRLSGVDAYRERLESDPAEWAVLDELCRVTISRFLRDRGVFADLARSVLPELAELATGTRPAGPPGPVVMRCWCPGCASGEEPYTYSLLWRLAEPRPWAGLDLQVLATDTDPAVLARARLARYPLSSVRELPTAWKEEAFLRRGKHLELLADYRAPVEFRRHDVRHDPPAGSFHLISCRNLVFTYFATASQVAALERFRSVLPAGGALVVGIHEQLPAGAEGFEPWPAARAVFRRG